MKFRTWLLIVALLIILVAGTWLLVRPANPDTEFRHLLKEWEIPDLPVSYEIVRYVERANRDRDGGTLQWFKITLGKGGGKTLVADRNFREAVPVLVEEQGLRALGPRSWWMAEPDAISYFGGFEAMDGPGSIYFHIVFPNGEDLLFVNAFGHKGEPKKRPALMIESPQIIRRE